MLPKNFEPTTDLSDGLIVVRNCPARGIGYLSKLAQPFLGVCIAIDLRGQHTPLPLLLA